MSRRLFKSTLTVGGNTLLSRVLGLLRDIVLARIFGAGAGTDAFFVAFKIPNFFRRLFAEGAFAQAFVPVLSETKTREDQQAVKALVDNTAGTLGGVLLALTVLALLATPVFIMVFGLGFWLNKPEQFDLAVEMLRVTFPYLMLISLTAFAGAILNSYGKFAVPAFTPVFLNLCLIGAALWLTPYFPEAGVKALAWGVLLAGIVQLAFQLPFLARLGLLPRPRWGWHFAGVRRILRLMLPAVVGSSAVQINLIVDTVIASFLVTGSVTWLYYADRMVEFPLGVFGIALATVILPKLSQQHAAENPQAFAGTLDWALRLVLVIGLPAALGLGLLAAPIIAALFGYEAFEAADVEMAALALMAYAIGLPAFILVKILASAYYSRQDTKTPVRIAIIAMLANIFMNLGFVVPLVQLGVAGPHAGLALATGLAAWLNAGLLYRGLRRSGVYSPAPGWAGLWLRVVPGLVGLGVVVMLVQPATAWFDMSWSSRAGWLAGIVMVAAAVYLLWLWLSGGWRLLGRATATRDTL
ncbi:MAG: murein biosynthesis integral membrane protein MurJ [Granulosicoccaceae bacterium]|jgi:putative peptidoglycan lipid II flippase